MPSSEHTKTPWLARLWPRKLTLGFGVAVCTAVLITEAIFLIPASYVWHRGNQAEAIETVRMAWYHSSDPAAFLSAEHKTRIGERMMRDGLLLGGVIYDGTGEPLSAFGERPLLDLNIARLSGVSIQSSPSSPAIDVHFTPEQTGLSHNIIVRLPTAPIEATTIRELREFALNVLFIAGLTALLFILASMLLVIRPLRAINTALRKAVQDPDQADAYKIHLTRRDEIGQIASSLNMLLTSVSVVYQDELSALKRANEDFGFGILHFDHEDRLVDANPMALKLFKQDDFAGLRRMNRNCAQPMGANDTRPIPILDLLGESSEPMLLTLHTDTSFFTALTFCATIKRPDGEITHRFVAIVAMDEILDTSRRAISSSLRAKDAIGAANKQVREMRRLMESCLCLIESEGGGEVVHDPNIVPDQIFRDWYKEAIEDELVTGKLVLDYLPPLAGDLRTVRNALRQAMFLAYAKSELERPVFKVETIKKGQGQTQFKIVDVTTSQPGGKNAPQRKTSIDSTLPKAALVKALARAGGSFDALMTTEGSVRVLITMNTAQSKSDADSTAALAKSA